MIFYQMPDTISWVRVILWWQSNRHNTWTNYFMSVPGGQLLVIANTFIWMSYLDCMWWDTRQKSPRFTFLQTKHFKKGNSIYISVIAIYTPVTFGDIEKEPLTGYALYQLWFHGGSISGANIVMRNLILFQEYTWLDCKTNLWQCSKWKKCSTNRGKKLIKLHWFGARGRATANNTFTRQ